MKRSDADKKQASMRPLRVGEEIRHALAEVMHDVGFFDPRLAGTSFTVSQVQVSPDLKHANVYVTPLGKSDDEAAELVKLLNKHASRFRQEVNRRVSLKFSAQLRFHHDSSFDVAARLEDLLRDPEETR